MSACLLLQVLTSLVGVAAVFAWILAIVTYVALLRDYDGPRSQLVFGSMWMLRANSLGPAAEPRRRRLGRVFLLFAALVVVAAGLAILGSGPICQ